MLKLIVPVLMFAELALLVLSLFFNTARQVLGLQPDKVAEILALLGLFQL